MLNIYRKWYERTVRFFKENKTAHILLFIAYKILPYVLFVGYPLLLVLEFFRMGFGTEWLKLVLIPLGTLIFVSVLRMIINAERPYEKYEIESVFGKKTVGNSMPSRHTTSAVVIAMAFMYVDPIHGIVGLVISFLIVLSRVLAGAHYLRDVLVGIIIGLVAGQLFWMI